LDEKLPFVQGIRYFFYLYVALIPWSLLPIKLFKVIS